MKTQLIISSLLLTAALSMNLSSKAESDSSLKRMIHEIPVTTEMGSSYTNEENLQIEGWMSDDQLWKLTDRSINNNEPVVEEELQIEAWMTNDNYFGISSNEVKTDESESPLCIENWMTDKGYWRF